MRTARKIAVLHMALLAACTVLSSEFVIDSKVLRRNNQTEDHSFHRILNQPHSICVWRIRISQNGDIEHPTTAYPFHLQSPTASSS